MHGNYLGHPLNLELPKTPQLRCRNAQLSRLPATLAVVAQEVHAPIKAYKRTAIDVANSIVALSLTSCICLQTGNKALSGSFRSSSIGHGEETGILIK